MDDHGVDHRALAQQQASRIQVAVHRSQDLLCQTVLFQQAAEVQDRGFVRHLAAGQRQVGELAYRRHVIQRLFHRRSAIAEPLLHDVNAQHRLDRICVQNLLD